MISIKHLTLITTDGADGAIMEDGTMMGDGDNSGKPQNYNLGDSWGPNPYHVWYGNSGWSVSGPGAGPNQKS